VGFSFLFMVTKNISKLPKSIAEVDIVVPWADLAGRWQETVQKIGSEVELQGFRKGQAPIDMVESSQMQQIQQEFLKGVMPQSLVESLQGTDVVPIDYPQYHG
jgi:FKBP-type peptidyl-prolyl cis-trans isomerase (trigger factor)